MLNAIVTMQPSQHEKLTLLIQKGSYPKDFCGIACAVVSGRQIFG